MSQIEANPFTHPVFAALLGLLVVLAPLPPAYAQGYPSPPITLFVCVPAGGAAGPDDEFVQEVMRLYKEGRLPFERLVKRYPLADINQAVADQHCGAFVGELRLP